MLKLVEPVESCEGILDDIARRGALQMLEAALKEEVQSYLDSFENERDESGHALVVRNGLGKRRRVTMGSGTLKVRAPRVNDKRVVDGERQKFTSSILPPYMRRSPKVAEVLPVLYLRGLSTGDFLPALKSLLGEDVSGLSSSNISRLTEVFHDEYLEFQKRSLADRKYAYIWADGIHFNVRLEEDRLCTLVVIGVRADGTKELVAVEDGYRESTESWASVLRDLKRRGMADPTLAVGDGALGFWAALCDIWPATKRQRCWVHKTANVLDKLPKRVQSKAKSAVQEIYNAETRKDALLAVDDFKNDYSAKWPRAFKSLEKDLNELLTFFEFPAEHWKHIRSTNVIESTFSTLRLRQRVTKGAGSRRKALSMAFKLLDMAQLRWRRISAPHLLPAVIDGTQFIDGLIAPQTTKKQAA